MLTFFIISLCFLSFNPDTDYYRGKWFFLMAMLGGLTVYNVACISCIPAVFLAYLLGSSFICRSRIQHNPMTLETLASYIGIISVVQVALLVDLKYFVGTQILIIIGAIWTLIKPKKFCKKSKQKLPVYGFGSNPSVEASLMSSLVAFSFLQPNQYTWYVTALAGISIIRTKAAIGALAFIVVVLINAHIAWIMIPIALIGLYFHNHKFLSPNGRFDIWKFIIEQTKILKINPWLGMGLGAFRIIIPMRQKETNTELVTPNMFFIWAHCDLLQFAIECGIIGIILLTLFVGHLVGLNLHNTAGLAFLACWGINSLGNFPNHMGPDSLLFAIFVRSSYLGHGSL